DTRQDVFPESSQTLSWICSIRWIDPHCYDAFRAKTSIKSPQVVQCAHKQARADEQEERKRDLHHDQRLTKARTSARARAGAVFERRVWFRACRRDRGRQA